MTAGDYSWLDPEHCEILVGPGYTRFVYGPLEDVAWWMDFSEIETMDDKFNEDPKEPG